ncbi:hypothetical protein ACNVED_13085 [Legionella sp. D16C41]|uniref:hypothetical protein n=1 Tax=Legionella sp. D16C41 TaxID=3402688 RepID=UPI003AF91C2A
MNFFYLFKPSPPNVSFTSLIPPKGKTYLHTLDELEFEYNLTDGQMAQLFEKYVEVGEEGLKGKRVAFYDDKLIAIATREKTLLLSILAYLKEPSSEKRNNNHVTIIHQLPKTLINDLKQALDAQQGEKPESKFCCII